ncbi:ABC transporter ATP-binding protein [Facklamia sp. P12950]|uniref:ABC transporter ATP-binding protein n=1 Tax=Facklamia sp. P12950 TaxID=3421951 RepID=UPI003D17014D
MAKLSLRKVAKIYDDGFKAVKNIDLEIEDKEFIVLVGPSGCGKSTTLRMIAGLESISEGELWIGDLRVNNLQPKDRDIAMVFQTYALYPHMNVRDNMGFSMKMNGISKKDRQLRVEQVAKALQLTELLDKKPGALSGGQRQRVALGRAMVRNPKVFLLDEPLSNLDAKLRVSMRSEITQLHRELGTTFVYVTHDQTEAMTMGTRIAVMNAGSIEQYDTPANLYYNPCNKFVAEFIGSPMINMFNGRLVIKDGKVNLKIADQSFELAEEVKDQLLVEVEDQEVYIGIRPEDMHHKAEGLNTSGLNVIAKNVEQVGSDTFVYFDHPTSSRELVARFSPARPVKIGEEVQVQLDLNKIMLFDQKTEASILNRIVGEDFDK